MTITEAASRVVRAVRYENIHADLCHRLTAMSMQRRYFNSSTSFSAVAPLHGPTQEEEPKPSRSSKTMVLPTSGNVRPPSYKDLTPAERAARAAERARTLLEEQQQKYTASRQLGGLADNSFFAEKKQQTTDAPSEQNANVFTSLSERSTENMSFALNPRPDARARWQRKMLIRHIRHGGRISRQVQIARTERSHVSQSHFFKTSVKKLAPLARQIAGKSIDQAILQMRFSKKKAAKDIRAHLIQARDEAVVVKGMGLGAVEGNVSALDSPVVADPGITPPLPHQNPTKSMKPGFEKSPTDMYVSEAWVNRGPYGFQPEYRARGRVNILKPPYTGITVLLKEEKTRTREKADKEAKAIKKRMGKNMWLQLPDRPITRQSQHVLW